MIIELRETAFAPYRELADLVERRDDLAGRYGANAVFIGAMRNVNEGESVHAMVLEHYPGMTERELERLCSACVDGVEVLELLVIHRVGEVLPGDPIVLVAVWTAHRAEAFRVCREVMEALKHQAPFWKREQLDDRLRWVETNTPG